MAEHDEEPTTISCFIHAVLFCISGTTF